MLHSSLVINYEKKVGRKQDFLVIFVLEVHNVFVNFVALQNGTGLQLKFLPFVKIHFINVLPNFWM